MRVTDGICINGDRHGPATHGVLCLRCRLMHRGGPIKPVRRMPVAELVQLIASTINVRTPWKRGTSKGI